MIGLGRAGGFVGVIAGRLADLCYPRACGLCGRIPSDTPGHLCHDCRRNLDLIHPPFCRRCGFPVAGRVEIDFDCHACTGGRQFDLARSACRYEGVIRDAIHHFKYRQALWLESDLVDLLEAAFHTHFEPVASTISHLVPVPLHRARRRERGFNQAELLALRLARRLGRPVLSRSLTRVKDTGSQTRLSAAARRRNVRNAFAWKPMRKEPPTGVLLIDDVTTTGSTVDECARVMKKAGIPRVFVLTLARD